MIDLVGHYPDVFDEYRDGAGLGQLTELTAEEVDAAYEFIRESDFEDELADQKEEFRQSGEESGIKSREYSRHYDNDEVATVLDDGTAVGWTFWYGGGKHGEPQAIDWMDSAYEVEVKQETRVVNVYSIKA